MTALRSPDSPPAPASVVNDDCLAVLSIASGLSPDTMSTASSPATVLNDPALAVLAEACRLTQPRAARRVLRPSTSTRRTAFAPGVAA